MEASEIKNPADLEKFIQQTVDGLISNRNSAQRDKAIIALGEMAVQIYEKAKAEKKEIKVDVEKLATEYATNDGMMAYVFPEKKKAFLDGYNQAMQSNADKKFSLDDVRKAYIQGAEDGVLYEDKFIESLTK